MGLITGSSHWASQIMFSVVQPRFCSISTTWHIGVPDGASLCSSFGLLLHAFACLAANRCCLESNITSTGVSPDSLISAPLGAVGSAPRTDLAYPLRRSWMSSCLPASLGSQQSSLTSSATAWTQATWMALTLSGTTLYVFVRVQSLASAALIFFIHRLWCSLEVRCASIKTLSQRVACLLNRMNRFSIFILAVGF